MANQWFRWYEGTCEDGKFRMVARNANVTLRDVIATWALMLEGASSSQNRGELRFQEDYIAAVLGFENEEIDRIFSAFEAAGLIQLGQQGGIVSNWNKRQFQSDKEDPTNAERQKRYREKTKHKRFSNVTVTEDKRPEADTDTDTDTDKKKVITRSPRSEPFQKPDDVDDIAWKQFLEHRKAKKSVVNEIVIKGFRREADKAGIPLQEAIEVSIQRGWVGFQADWMNENKGGKNGSSTGKTSIRKQLEDIAANGW